MDYAVFIQQDRDSWFIGSIPAIHGCRAQAKTKQELYKRLQESAQVCLEAQKQQAEPLDFVGVDSINIPAYA